MTELEYLERNGILTTAGKFHMISTLILKLQEKEAENAALRDEITSLRVQLGVIGEFVKDRVNTALEIE
jgi:hypothetical protein